MDVSPGTHPKVTPQQDTHKGVRTRNRPFTTLLLIHSLYYLSSRVHVYSPHTCLCLSGQDMGQDVEPYFQEVLATLEQRAEEGNRGKGDKLRSRLQQLYSEIITDTNSGTSSLKMKYSKATQGKVSLGHKTTHALAKH